MGILDWTKGQFIEIIEWVEDDRQTLLYRFPVYRKEIKQGARLTVREGQVALFVSEGKLADVFEPGLYTISTRNLPILSSLQGWKFGFESPFKSEVYFLSTRLFSDQKWGTTGGLMKSDPELGMVLLMAHGTYAFQVTDPAAFLRQHAGTTGHLDADTITNHLRNLVVSRFADVLGESKLPAAQLLAGYDEIASELQKRVNEIFRSQGMALQNLAIGKISFPPEVEKAIMARSKMAIIGDMGRYMQMQAADSVPLAAANPGNPGMSMGAGLAMGNVMAAQMAAAMQQPGVDPVAAAPASAAAPVEGVEARLAKVAKLQASGLISEEEAKTQRARILSEL